MHAHTHTCKVHTHTHTHTHTHARTNAYTHIHKGVGVSLEETFDGGLENNTSILNPYSQEITVVCQSALRDPCRSGGWKSPNNTYIVSPEQNRSCSTDVDIFSSTRLTVSPDLPDGLYTCVIPDESLIMRSIYIGIYSHFEEKSECISHTLNSTLLSNPVTALTGMHSMSLSRHNKPQLWSTFSLYGHYSLRNGLTHQACTVF